MTGSGLIPIERVERVIRVFRGQKVLLDSDLAELYGVETRSLVQAVSRHTARFPKDFMFQLTPKEFARLKSQIVISNAGRPGRGGRRTPPYAFTEQGVAMLSSVLNSPLAIEVNIEIMRAFVRLRRLLSSNAGLARKLAALEKKYDSQFRIVFDAIREMMEPEDEETERARIGFRAD